MNPAISIDCTLRTSVGPVPQVIFHWKIATIFYMQRRHLYPSPQSAWYLQLKAEKLKIAAYDILAGCTQFHVRSQTKGQIIGLII